MTENDLEHASIDWFRELGWVYSHGETLSPGGSAPERAHYNEVILAPRFRAALERLNPELPVAAIDDAEKRVQQFAGQSLVEANRDLYVWLRDGIPVDVELDGHRRQLSVFPGIGEAAQAQFWTGLRPATPGNLPYIGASPITGLYLNTGHGTLGWTHGCGSGRAIADIIDGRRPDCDFAFSGLTTASA